jgi:UDP-N-acetylglucosamine 4,6-dehydratase/5-epimerase
MNILITGGTGSLGSRLTAKFLREGHQVTVLSRNAHHQHELWASVQGLVKPGQLLFVLGDVTEPTYVARAMFHVGGPKDILIHAAAHKRIERGETDPEEYMRTNIQGTLVVAREARHFRIPKCLLISTDKAVAPLNTYGVSKAMAERLWLSFSSDRNYFGAVRYGNVVESNGSVWHYWQQQQALGQALTVRDPEPTRFFMTLEQAVGVVESALTNMNAIHKLFVPADLEAFSLWDLARQIQPQEQWAFSPLSPGEKQHELLTAPGETALRANPLLYSIRYGFDSLPQLSSETAQRISGAELARRLYASHR